MKKENLHDSTSEVERLSKQKNSSINSVEDCFHLAELALSRQDFFGSLNYLNKAIGLDGSNTSLIRKKIFVLFQLRRYEEIKLLIEELLRIDKNDIDAQQGLALIEHRIRYHAVVNQFRLYS